MKRQQFRITGMDCADCALKLEQGLSRLAGVESCQVNFITAKMEIIGESGSETIIGHIRALGYDVAPAEAVGAGPAKGRLIGELLGRPRNSLTLAGLFLVVAAFLVRWFLPAAAGLSPWLFFGGGLLGLYFPAKSGWAALRSGHGLDMNVLMSLAAVGAFAIGEYAEAAMVIVLFSLGEALEEYTVNRARASLRTLTELAPQQALLLRPCLDCQGCRGRPLPDGAGLYESGPCPWCARHEETIPVDQLVVGDQIVVKPGQRIPMDGFVLSGYSAVNQAPLTGESIPVEKKPDAEVYAGTINGQGLLEIQVTRLAADTTLSRLIHLVEEAQSQKTPTQRFVDRFARLYTPAVVVGALLVAGLPPLLFGAPFLDTAEQHGWLYRALTLLIIACPCALVIATPVTVVSAITAAARRGILIKGGAYLEALGQIKVVAFDKTGTLTQGRPELVSMGCVDECCQEARLNDPWVRCQHCDEMLSTAAALERYSTHPLAQAIVNGAEQRALPALRAKAVENLPGRGVRGQIEQARVVIGSHTFLHDQNLCPPTFCQAISHTEAQGQTTMLVQRDEALLGYLALSDPPRQASRSTITALKANGVDQVVMLTGDTPAVATTIGQRLGVDAVQAGLLPADKVTAIQALVQQYGPSVAMVGDGVNDAPALASATVGVAMGATGTAQALETADVALMADDLSQLPVAIRLGRRAGRNLRFNISFALLVKAVFLIAALFGVATLWMAVFADVGASLLVTMNGMRLLKAEAGPENGRL
jgi:Cd2+/Zn2+-exporting ATPase